MAPCLVGPAAPRVHSGRTLKTTKSPDREVRASILLRRLKP